MSLLRVKPYRVSPLRLLHLLWVAMAAQLCLLQVTSSTPVANSSTPLSSRELADREYLSLHDLFKLSYSQNPLHQDVFVTLVLGQQRGGFFIEFGANEGRELSNSLMLEESFGWKGILAEPNRINHEPLRQNRPDTIIDTRCVWTRSGEFLKFTETNNSVFSTVSTFTKGDGHAGRRGGGKEYEVETVSLVDLLAQHDAPQSIDYLSIDTEGSEFDILSAYFMSPGSKDYTIRIITVEHNRTRRRGQIRELLLSQGYVHVWKSFSYFDDFYVTRDLAQKAQFLEKDIAEHHSHFWKGKAGRGRGK